MKTLITSALLFGAVVAMPGAQAVPGSVPFDKGWELRGDGASIKKDGGRDVLQVETGFAFRRDVKLQDGTIDFDVQVSERRSFVYLYFRMASDGEREEFYLRPHKSNLPDAVQYAPVWQNRSAWQLHHGPGGTALVGFTPGRWTRVRAVIQGRRAALFIGDLTTPALVVPHLAREPQPGYIAFGGFIPADTPGIAPSAKFADVVVRPNVVEFDFAAALAKEPAAKPSVHPVRVIREWSVSKAFVLKDPMAAALPPAADVGAVERVKAEESGLVQLHRHIAVPADMRVATTVARITVTSSRAATAALELGFSDVATVFVNGTPVFRGDASYSFDRPRREGLIGYDQVRLYLPLRAGENDVAILLSDSFGGWGLMGRFVGPAELGIK